MRTAALMALLTGCRLYFDPAGAGDAGGAGGDVGDAGDGSVVTPPCSLIAHLADDFEDGANEPSKWGTYSSNTTIAEAGGDLVITLAPNTVPQQYAGYKSVYGYDLRGSRVFVEWAGLPSDPAAHMGFNLEYEQLTFVTIGIQNNMLHARQMINAVPTPLDAITFDPVAHKYWAISESAGMLHFEYSSDGVNFTSFYDMVPPFDVSVIQVNLMGGTDGSLPTPGTARYAALNGGVASGSACPAASLSDSFDDGVIGHEWNEIALGGGCMYQETGGVLHMSSSGTAGQYASLRTAHAWSLRDSAIAVHVTTPPTAATRVTSVLMARVDLQNSLEFQISQGMLFGRTVINSVGTNGTGMPLPLPGMDVYIRIREASGQVYFEASTDGTNWPTVVRQIATPFSVDNVGIILQVGSNIGTTADFVEFDDLGGP